MRIEKCKGPNCEDEILWRKTEADKWIPLDLKPVRMFIDVNKEFADGVTVSVVRSVAGYMPHHATCVDADSFRKKEKR